MRRWGALLVLVGAFTAAAPASASPTQHSHRFLIAKHLNASLAALCRAGSGGCALRGQGFVIEAVAWQEHLSPGFMVGASFTESSGGDSPCHPNTKNIWGLDSCGTGYFIHGPVPQFPTWASAFDYYAQFIHSRWPSARTAYDLPGYSACDACWGPRTALWMSRLGFGPSLRYP